MRSFNLQFLNRLIWFTFFTAALILGLAYLTVPREYVSKALPFLFPFFFSVTLIVHYFLTKACEMRPAIFVTRFMLTSFLKLLFYLVVLVVYLLLNPGEALRFSIPFLLLYSLFTGFEVWSLVNFTRKKTGEHKSEP
jgi:hypothetical protein